MVYAVKMFGKLMLGAFCFSQGTNERPGLMPLAMSRIITMEKNSQSLMGAFAAITKFFL